jgi:hypothetical protein
VALDESGRPDFSLLQERISAGRSGTPVPLVYQAFDLLYLDGRSLVDVPLEQRKKLLELVLRPTSRVRYATHIDTEGVAFFEAAKAQQLEGIVAKQRRSRYEPGRRTPAWLKIKARPEQELVVGGWTPGEGNAKDLGAVVVGVYEDERLRFSGKVGSGFTGRTRAELRAALDALEREAVVLDDPGADVISALDPSFRAQELSFVVAQIAGNVELAAAAECRSWPAQLLGRRPAGVTGTLSAVQERAGSHVARNSLWLRSSVRGAVGLALAVLVAELTGVQHSFWVVLGTLSVLRSNALSTGENVLRGLLGTAAGFFAGGLLVAAVGTNTTLLWILLPPAVLFAGLAPAAISFAAGQAAFTLTLLILFNILAPEGWEVGLVRIEDVALGSAVSLAVGALFWPRGAAGALGTALAAAYVDSANYLAGAVEFGTSRCDAATPDRPAPAAAGARAAAASRRLDDTFRTFLAERGAKRVPLADVTSLVTGVVALRLAGDAVLDLWQREDTPAGDYGRARAELLEGSRQMTGWYADLATSLAGRGAVPAPVAHDAPADGRLVEAVTRDLPGENGHANPTAVRMIWTGDHLDAARRLESSLAEAAALIRR